MQFLTVLNMFIVKTELISIFTNDLKRKEHFSKNVHSYRPSLFKQMEKKVFTNLCSLSFVYLDLFIFWQIMLES